VTAGKGRQEPARAPSFSEIGLAAGAGMSGEADAESSAIDRAADRFERDWKAGRVPLIEDYLAGAPGERRGRLFEELLYVERELRSRSGDLPDAEDYRRRFPDFADVIDRNFAGPCAGVAIQRRAELPTTVGDAVNCPVPHGTPPVSRAQDPRFRVLRHHADGGIGRVSVALDLELHRQVALKELQDRFADDPEFRQRFLLEVEVTGRLEHPGVIPVYSLGRDEQGRPFYAMRFIEGEDLERAISRFHAADAGPARDPGERALTLRRLLRRFVDVCNVVAYAHSRGVLHRDLKPGNILLGPYGETLVVDWGMAKRLDGPATPSGMGDETPGSDGQASGTATAQGLILGTIPYMSPEQADGGSVGTRSDVYSLGATLYHIVAGRAPIAKGDKLAMLSCVRRGEFSPPRQVNPRVPAALEAICQKAMRGRPEDRYASPRALADEIEHWLADEPVSAWREPWAVRARRWLARRRSAVASAVAAAAVAVATIAIAYLLYDYRLRIVERTARADKLLAALQTAEVTQVTAIVEELLPLRSIVLERLRSITRAAAPGRSRRNAALALVSDDPSQAEYLLGRIVQEDVDPREISVVRQFLFDHQRGSIPEPRLWQVLEEGRGRGSPNLGAAGVLALYCPDDPRWVEFATPIASALVLKAAPAIGDWREVFQPIERRLLGPLRAIFGDVRRPRETRSLAVSLLLLHDFAVQPDNPARDRDLAELIGDANPDEFLVIRRALIDPQTAAAELLKKLQGEGPFDEIAARRRGRIATALVVLRAPDRAWPLLARNRSADVAVRTEMIHDFAAYGVDPGVLAARLAVETDTAARRALVLALGEYAAAAIPEQARRLVVERLRALYAHDGDPGTHSAIEWLLHTKWNLGRELDPIDESSSAHEPAADRDWFRNTDGVTMAVIRAVEPIEFEIGSPEDEDGRDSDERIHTVGLDRSFAIATREVTVAHFERYLDSEPGARHVPASNRAANDAQCPVVGIDWFAAAGYCNWLSRREKLDPYYLIRGPVLSIPHREGLGYRLPSEHEWEYACRAGVRASRPHGASEALLVKYAWFVVNSEKHPHPVGLKQPNDLGLFDILGNAFEWTEDRYSPDRDAARPRPDRAGAKIEAPEPEIEVVLRGGSFNGPATSLRSAYRERSAPSAPLGTYGFRYARTLKLAPAQSVRAR
jgi:formylglycine-generating enzyme required for sulfatase activity